MNPLDLIAALRLESGATWGDTAEPFQWADAEAIFDPGGPVWHFLTRPRGGSKSTDLAAVLLGWVTCVAVPGEHGYIVASDKDQGGFAVLDAIAGLIRRTPELRGLVEIQSSKVIASSGATVEVLAADGSSTWGLRPAFIVCDEIAQWGSTRNASNVWNALISATGKMPGCRLVLLTSAGEPSHWSYKVFKTAQKSERWRVNEVPGPLPWADPKNLAEQKLLLSESLYQRLHENIWVEADDRLVTAEDLEAAVRDEPEGVELPPMPGVSYVVTLDVGLVRDRTVVIVAHKEVSDAGALVVVDVVWYRQGSRRNKVSLDEIQSALLEFHGRYPGRVFIDPAKAEHIHERLSKAGVPISQFNFGTTSVGILASALIRALRTRTLSLPNHPVMLDELATVRIIENGAGVARLGHDSDKHDDFAVALSLAVYELSTWKGGGEVLFAPDTVTVALDGTPLQTLVGSFAMSPDDTFASHLQGLGQ